jgi:hypothetical protein
MAIITLLDPSDPEDFSRVANLKEDSMDELFLLFVKEVRFLRISSKTISARNNLDVYGVRLAQHDEVVADGIIATRNTGEY